MPYRMQVLPRKRRRHRIPTEAALTGPHSLQNWTTPAMAGERLFPDLPGKARARLDAISCTATYPKHAVVFIEGQKPLGVFLLRAGQVRLSTSSADGKSVIVGRAGPGEILGLPTAISGRLNELTAEAIEPLRCDFVAREALLQFLQEYGDAAFQAAKILSGMYDAAFTHVRDLGLSASATEKLIRLLLNLPVAEFQTDEQTKQVSLTHKEIAEMIGASRETVTRLFSRLKKDQLLQIEHSRLRILDRSRLEQMLQM